MKVEIRIYRRHDADLMMLRGYGINIPKLMKLSLERFAHGQRVQYCLPSSMSYDISPSTLLRYRLDIHDAAAIRILRSVKRGYRNQFCKDLLRDALNSEPLGVFFEDEAVIETETARLSSPVACQDDLSEILRPDARKEEEKKKKQTAKKTSSLPRAKETKTNTNTVSAENRAPSPVTKKTAPVEQTYDDFSDDSIDPFADLRKPKASSENKNENKNKELLSMFRGMLNESRPD